MRKLKCADITNVYLREGIANSNASSFQAKLLATVFIRKSFYSLSDWNHFQWRIQDFPNGGVLFCHKWGGAHPVFR